MTAPRTEAGRALLDELAPTDSPYGRTRDIQQDVRDGFSPAILAIEAEATALDEERLMEAMERCGVSLGQPSRYAAIARAYAALLGDLDAGPEEPCPQCHGRGWYADGPTAKPEQVQCFACHGSGSAPRSEDAAHPDAGVLERNHYAWFMPADPEAAVNGYLDDFEAKMKEALTDPFVHDMAQSVLPLIAAYRVTLDPRPAPDTALREAAVHALAGAMSLEVPVMPTRRESARAWTEWFDQFAANLLDHPWSDEQRVALRAALEAER